MNLREQFRRAIGGKPKPQTFGQKLLYSMANEWADDAKREKQLDAIMEVVAKKKIEWEARAIVKELEFIHRNPGNGLEKRTADTDTDELIDERIDKYEAKYLNETTGSGTN